MSLLNQWPIWKRTFVRLKRSASHENWELISITFADRVIMLGSSSS